jgi:hypothetical protein
MVSFSDFGVSVNFFVDGDALLANAFEDTLLDWEHGGQPLQVIYRVNKFLQMLLDRRAHRFHVLFFSDAGVVVILVLFTSFLFVRPLSPRFCCDRQNTWTYH